MNKHFHIINGRQSGPAIELPDGSHYHRYGLFGFRKTEPTWSNIKDHFHEIKGREVSVANCGNAVWPDGFVKGVSVGHIAPERIILPHVFRQPVYRRDRFGRLRQIPPIGGGAAGTWQFTNGGRTSLLNGTFDIDSDTWKMALFLSTSNLGASSTTYAGVTNEHANGNGYTTGGISITLTLAGTTTVTVDISTDPVWTASGGSIVARFAAIYEVSGNVLCYCLLDSTPADVTATSGNTLTVAANASGVFTLA